MKASSKQTRMALFLAGSLLGAAGIFGQAPAKPPQQQPAPAPAPATGDKSAAPQAAPLTLESTPPPVNAEEEAAVKAFRAESNADSAKKDQIAEVPAEPLSPGNL
jgi:hypothetical protein